jgi:hypothetical protein
MQLRLNLVNLGLANPRATRRTVLEPELIEAALARMGERRLTRAEQEIVMRAVKKPGDVAWPEWWEVRGD